MAYVEHRLDVYGTALFLATNKKDWKALGRRIDLGQGDTPSEEVSGQVTSGAWRPEERTFATHALVIWVDTQRHVDAGALIDTCAHEASHAAGRILEVAGHYFSYSDEAHAYLCGWLTRWIWEHCPDTS